MCQMTSSPTPQVLASRSSDTSLFAVSLPAATAAAMSTPDDRRPAVKPEIGDTSGNDFTVSNEAFEIGSDYLAHYLKMRLFESDNAKTPANRGNANSDLFVVDCRSFIQYNNCHVRSAVNAFYSKIMRRRLVNDAVCSDAILNHLSLAGGTENVDLVLYGSDDKYDDALQARKSGALCATASCMTSRAVSQKHSSAGTGGRTLYERRKQAENGNSVNVEKRATSNVQPAKPLSLKMPKKKTMTGDTCSLSALATTDAHIDFDRSGGACSFIRFLFEKLRNSTRLKFRRVMLLSGGFDDFHTRYPNLCESSRQQQKRQLEEQLDENGRKTLYDVNVGQPPLATAPPTMTGAVFAPCFNGLTAAVSSKDAETHYNCMDNPSTSQEDNGPTKLYEYLYLGTMDDAENEIFLQENGITCVINICERNFCPSCVKNDTSHFKQICVKDSTDTKLLPLFNEVIQFIDNARRNGDKVLIHCQAGISRSATLAIAYVISNMRAPFRKAYEFVKCRRKTIEPNFGFIYQLMKYADEVQEEQPVTLITKQGNYSNDNDTPISQPPDSVSDLETKMLPTSENIHLEVPPPPLVSISHSSSLSSITTNDSSGKSSSPYAKSPDSRSNVNFDRGRNSETRKRAMYRRSYANKYAKTGSHFRSVDSYRQTHSGDVPSPTTEFSKLDISLFSATCGKHSPDVYNMNYLKTDPMTKQTNVHQLQKGISNSSATVLPIVTVSELAYNICKDSNPNFSTRSDMTNEERSSSEDEFSEEISVSSDMSTSSADSGSMGSQS